MKQPELTVPLHGIEDGFDTFCLRKLAGLESLEPGWDSEGAPEIDRAILEAVRRFVRSVPDGMAPRPMVVPLSSGHVQLEWHSGRRVLELEFESSVTVHYLKWDPDHQVEDEGLISTSDAGGLIDLITWFANGSPDA
jgi:hypothetical protein